MGASSGPTGRPVLHPCDGACARQGHAEPGCGLARGRGDHLREGHASSQAHASNLHLQGVTEQVRSVPWGACLVAVRTATCQPAHHPCDGAYARQDHASLGAGARGRGDHLREGHASLPQAHASNLHLQCVTEQVRMCHGVAVWWQSDRTGQPAHDLPLIQSGHIPVTCTCQIVCPIIN